MLLRQKEKTQNLQKGHILRDNRGNEKARHRNNATKSYIQG